MKYIKLYEELKGFEETWIDDEPFFDNELDFKFVEQLGSIYLISEYINEYEIIIYINELVDSFKKTNLMKKNLDEYHETDDYKKIDFIYRLIYSSGYEYKFLKFNVFNDDFDESTWYNMYEELLNSGW